MELNCITYGLYGQISTRVRHVSTSQAIVMQVWFGEEPLTSTLL